MWTNGNGFKRLVNKNGVIQNWLDLSLRVVDLLRDKGRMISHIDGMISHEKNRF